MQQVLITTVLLFVAEPLINAQQYVPVLVPAAALNQSPPIFNSSWLYGNTKPINNTQVAGQYLPHGNDSYANHPYRPPTGSYNPNYVPNLNHSRFFPYYNGTYIGNYGEDIILGSIQYQDRLLFSQIYRKDYSWWTSKQKIVQYNAGYQRISAIRIYNHKLDGLTSKATILGGGIGYSYVRFKLESQRNRGFQFLVEIYGH
ncbi:uncharacterized protein [Euwallacea fornicatus]|uniref:uncharacterized protein n=1 Tax=Euwallacea fornicatus TaxID=995702 RepID=UPI00338E0ED2